MSEINKQRIAKNTTLMYIRMGITMLISLYTSRVILQVLGETDMGIYATVGGVVGFIGFINAALNNGTSRFITFSLGRDELSRQKITFSTVFWLHFAMGILLVIVVEVLGVWFLNTKLNIPSERMYAAKWCFHLSVVSLFFSITQVPYSACIISHEKISIYAYMGVIDSLLKLLIVYILLLFNVDKLILYSVLFLILSISMMIFYRLYCKFKFLECHVTTTFDKAIFGSIAKFSGWQLFTNGSLALANQGVLVMINMFFSPAVVTARAISLQVNGAAMQFVDNFRVASNPQIVKLYAAEEYTKSKELLIDSTKIAFFLMLVISIPIFLLSDEILHIWLGVVPKYTSVFLKLVIIQSLIQTINSSLYTGLYATGDIKYNAMLSTLTLCLAFCVTYALYKKGSSPIALSYAYIVCYAIQTLIIKPILFVKTIEVYNSKDFICLFKCCFIVASCSFLLSYIVFWAFTYFYPIKYVLRFLLIVVLSIIISGLVIWFLGIDTNSKNTLIRNVSSRFTKK